MIKRQLNQSDVNEITRVHIKAFNNFFLSQLGESFLRLYYSCFLKNSNSICVGIFDEDGSIIGFSVATINSKGFNRNLIIQNLLSFIGIGLKLLFTKPKALIRLFLNLSKNTKNSDINDDGDYAELFSIAVDPQKQGGGVGKVLLADIEEILKNKGCNRITLTTDFYNNSNVINFYEKMGYTIFYDFLTYPNRKMYKMIKTLN
jgi:ribosomal protein S18 acetylase RimI-like enzyme